jgi:hypothetical protein
MKYWCLNLMMPVFALTILTACAQIKSTPTSTPTQVISRQEVPTPALLPATPSPLLETPTVGSAPSQSVTGWPMFRYSLDRAGYNPTEGELEPPLELRWQFDAKGKI